MPSDGSPLRLGTSLAGCGMFLRSLKELTTVPTEVLGWGPREGRPFRHLPGSFSARQHSGTWLSQLGCDFNFSWRLPVSSFLNCCPSWLTFLCNGIILFLLFFGTRLHINLWTGPSPLPLPATFATCPTLVIASYTALASGFMQLTLCPACPEPSQGLQMASLPLMVSLFHCGSPGLCMAQVPTSAWGHGQSVANEVSACRLQPRAVVYV